MIFIYFIILVNKNIVGYRVTKIQEINKIKILNKLKQAATWRCTWCCQKDAKYVYQHGNVPISSGRGQLHTNILALAVTVKP